MSARDHLAAALAEDAQQRSARLGVRHAVDRARRVGGHRASPSSVTSMSVPPGACAFSAAGVSSASSLPLIDDGQAVAELVRLLHVVRRHHDRAPLRVQLAQDVPQREPRLRIEADRRLVEEDHARLVRSARARSSAAAAGRRTAASTFAFALSAMPSRSSSSVARARRRRRAGCRSTRRGRRGSR